MNLRTLKFNETVNQLSYQKKYQPSHFLLGAIPYPALQLSHFPGPAVRQASQSEAQT